MKSTQWNKLENVIEQITPLAEKYLNQDEVNRIKQKLDEVLNESRVRVMIYGTYNAGKSTLINTLIGQEVAKMGEIPTTDQVDVYPWGEVVLLDTPGVNAPIEHENITQETLKAISLVVLVLRDGDQDTRNLYERLFEQLRQNKRVMVIINYQGTRKEGLELLVHMQARVNEKALESGLSEQLLYSNLSFYAVNLMDAWLAKTDEDYIPLLETSGITQLESALRDWLNKHDQESVLLENAVCAVKSYLINSIEQVLSSKMGESEKDDSLDFINHQLSMLKTECTTLQQKVCQHADHLCQQKRVALIQAIEGVMTNHGIDESQLQEHIEQLFAPVQEKLSNYVHQHCEQAESLNHFADMIDAIKSGETTHIVIRSEDGSTATMEITEEISTTIKMFIGSGQFREVSQTALKESMLLLREMKIPFFKGRWEKTFDKWAERLSKGLGVAIQIAMATYQIYSAYKEQEEYNRRQEKYQKALNQDAQNIIEQVSVTLCKVYSEQLHNIYAPQLEILQKTKQQLLAHQDELARDLDKLNQAKQSLYIMMETV